MVVCITGNGYKTAEVMAGHVEKPVTIGRSLSEFVRVIGPELSSEGSGGRTDTPPVEAPAGSVPA